MGICGSQALGDSVIGVAAANLAWQLRRRGFGSCAAAARRDLS
jgi:hypothetical protein